MRSLERTLAARDARIAGLQKNEDLLNARIADLEAENELLAQPTNTDKDVEACHLMIAEMDARLTQADAMAEALEAIAKQKRPDEMTDDEYADADLDGGYDTCITTALAALAAWRKGQTSSPSQEPATYHGSQMHQAVKARDKIVNDVMNAHPIHRITATDQPLNARQNELMALIGTEWQQAPLCTNSATLLSLRDRGLIEHRLKPGVSASYAFTRPWNSSAFQWRRCQPTPPPGRPSL